MLTVPVPLQLLASVYSTVYVPALNPFATAEFPPDGIQVYVKGGLPLF